MAPTEIVLDSANQNLTIYTLKVEEIIAKTINKITSAQTSKNWSSGPNTTKVIDLLRVEKRFNIDGWIAYSDRSKINNINNAGGVFTLDYAGSTYNVNFEKISKVEDARIVDRNVSNDPAWLFVKFSVLVGENMSSS